MNTPNNTQDAMAAFSPATGSDFQWIDAKPLPCGSNDYRAVPEGEYTTDCWVREKDGSLDIRREHHRSGAGFMDAYNRGAKVIAIKIPRVSFAESLARGRRTRNWA